MNRTIKAWHDGEVDYVDGDRVVVNVKADAEKVDPS